MASINLHGLILPFEHAHMARTTAWFLSQMIARLGWAHMQANVRSCVYLFCISVFFHCRRSVFSLSLSSFCCCMWVRMFPAPSSCVSGESSGAKTQNRFLFSSYFFAMYLCFSPEGDLMLLMKTNSSQLSMIALDPLYGSTAYGLVFDFCED